MFLLWSIREDKKERGKRGGERDKYEMDNFRKVFLVPSEKRLCVITGVEK